MRSKAGPLVVLAVIAAALAAFGALLLPRMGAEAGETVLAVDEAEPVLVTRHLTSDVTWLGAPGCGQLKHRSHLGHPRDELSS